MIRIAVLSDIHFGKNAVQKEFALSGKKMVFDAEKSKSMKEEIIKLFVEKKPEYIFIPGDLTSQALPSEFFHLYLLLKDILAESKCEDSKVIFSAGNHDTQWKISCIGDIDDCIEHDSVEMLAIASTPFERNFKYTIPLKNMSPVPFSGLYEDDRIQAIVLNTGYYSRENEKYHHGKIGVEQYEWLKKIFPLNKNKWRIMLMHHHPYRYHYPSVLEDISCIEEGDEIVEYAGKNGIDVIIHGHRHHPIISTKNDTLWANPITFLCAGSLSVNSLHRGGGQIPNTLHILEFEDEKKKSSIIKAINYEFSPYDGWKLSTFKKETPYDGEGYFGEIINDDELYSSMKQIIESSRSTRESNIYFELPNYSTLSQRVKCAELIRINEMVDRITEEGNEKRHGYYPSEVLIKG